MRTSTTGMDEPNVTAYWTLLTNSSILAAPVSYFAYWMLFIAIWPNLYFVVVCSGAPSVLNNCEFFLHMQHNRLLHLCYQKKCKL